MGGWGPFHFGGFGPVTRLFGTTFRLVLLALIACLALVVARRAVEGSAQRVSDEPVRSTVIGLVAWVLFVPMFMLIGFVLAISFVGIPLLLLVPFAVLFLLLMAVVGFTGTASAVGQWARRRFGLGTPSGFADMLLGILIILMPLLLGRLVAFAAGRSVRSRSCWSLTGLTVEFLAWSGGFGAVLINAFSRWQASRGARRPASAPVNP